MAVIEGGDWDGYFDWATKDPGPIERLEWFDRRRTPMDSIIHHCMVGVYHYPNGYNVIRDPARKPTLWCGTIEYPSGELRQHAPVYLWTQHAHDGNARGPGFEAEGFPSWGGITDAMVETYLHIHHDLAEYNERQYQRNPGTRRGLLEHKEAAPGKTSCPMGYYDPLWKAIAEGRTWGDDELSAEDKRLLANLATRVGNLESDVARAEKIIGGVTIEAQTSGIWGDAARKADVLALFKGAKKTPVSDNQPYDDLYTLTGENALEFMRLQDTSLMLANTRLNREMKRLFERLEDMLEIHINEDHADQDTTKMEEMLRDFVIAMRAIKIDETPRA